MTPTPLSATSALVLLWAGARVRERLTMKKIEKLRTGRNVRFPRDADGWIEVSLLEL
jgi:hypothetical protein